MSDEEEYVVEAILAWRYSLEHQCKEYFVKWQNYSINDSTWEPQSNLNCPDLLQLFEHTLDDEDRRYYESQQPDQLNGFQRHAKFRACLALDHAPPHQVEGNRVYCLLIFEDSQTLEEISIDDFIKYQPMEAVRYLESILYQSHGVVTSLF